MLLSLGTLSSWELEAFSVASSLPAAATLILPLLIISKPAAGTANFFIASLAAAASFPSSPCEHPSLQI